MHKITIAFLLLERESLLGVNIVELLCKCIVCLLDQILPDVLNEVEWFLLNHPINGWVGHN